MSDSLRLYRTIIEMIRDSRVRFHDMRCLVTFAWAIVGLLMEKSVHVSKWSVVRVGEAQAASKERLVQEFRDWCREAEATRIAALAEFAERLRRYSLVEPATA